MKERIKVQEALYSTGALKKEETDLQIYIAVQQALFKFDTPIINYNLIKYKYPFWDNPSPEHLLTISKNIYVTFATFLVAVFSVFCFLRKPFSVITA